MQIVHFESRGLDEKYSFIPDVFLFAEDLSIISYFHRQKYEKPYNSYESLMDSTWQT